MRNPSDSKTIEVHGLSGYQVNRSEQKVRITQQGYQGPKERNRCEKCRYVMAQTSFPDTQYERHYLRCAVGDFPVLRGGICREFKAD